MSDDDPAMDDMRTRTAKTRYVIEFVGGPHDGLVTYWEELPPGTFHAEWHRLYDLRWDSGRYVLTRKISREGRLLYEFRGRVERR